MQRVRDSIRPAGIRKRLERAGVQLVNAEASFVAPHVVQGGDLQVEAPLIVLNTGHSPAVPPIPGLPGTPYMTYHNFWKQTQLPPRMLIIGAGYIGLELGQGMQRLGAQVQIVEKGKHPLEKEEEDVSRTLQEALTADGVQFFCNSTVEQVEYRDGCFHLQTAAQAQPLVAESLLVVAGQQPNVEGLALEKAGIKQTEDGYIQVDAQFQTTAEGVYAIGDVTGQPAFTHVSWEDHRRLYAILRGEERSRGDRVLGYAIFTDPQVGRMGLTAAQAEEQGFKVRQATLPLNKIGRARMSDDRFGFYRMVVEKQSDRILGATLVGRQAAELVHVFWALMEAGATWQTLEQGQPIHPTYAESLPTLARELYDQ
jgi:dihydrolipoamide dehydrogenase